MAHVYQVTFIVHRRDEGEDRDIRGVVEAAIEVANDEFGEPFMDSIDGRVQVDCIGVTNDHEYEEDEDV